MHSVHAIRLYNIMIGSMKTQAIYVAAELGIADHIKNTPKTLHELAGAVDAKADRLFRLLRALCSLGLLSEKNGAYHLTDMGHMLREDMPASLKPFALLLGSPSWWSAWGNLLHSIKTGECAFDYANALGFFEYLEHQPKQQHQFYDFMTRISQMNSQAVIQNFAFSPFKTIVDVGGGHGELLFSILRAHPHINGILFDQAKALPGTETVDNALSERTQLIAGNFFESIPSGGDCYILQQILHDWNDENSIKILRHCRNVMHDSSKLLVIDAVVTPDNLPSFNKITDLHMMVLSHGGKERTAAEFKSLFQCAGLNLTEIIPTGTAFSIISGQKAD